MEFIKTWEQCLGKKAKKYYCPMQTGDVPKTFADVDALPDSLGGSLTR